MKYLIRILFFLILAAIATGYYFKWNNDHVTGDKIIGFAVLSAAFLLIPMFIIHRSKGKKFKDYMFTQENLDKMNENKNKKPEK